MITYIIVGVICFLIGGAVGTSISNDELTMLKDNNQPQINIIIDGKSIEEYIRKEMKNG